MMTATRIARVGRTRLFVGLGALFLVVTIAVLFRNSQEELEHARLALQLKFKVFKNRTRFSLFFSI